MKVQLILFRNKRSDILALCPPSTQDGTEHDMITEGYECVEVVTVNIPKTSDLAKNSLFRLRWRDKAGDAIVK